MRKNISTKKKILIFLTIFLCFAVTLTTFIVVYTVIKSDDGQDDNSNNANIIDLATFLSDDLGEINTVGAEATLDEVTQALLGQYPSLKQDQIILELLNNTDLYVKASPSSLTYKGQATMHFVAKQIPVLVNLSSVLQHTDLGNLEVPYCTNTPTKEQILSFAKTLNTNLIIDQLIVTQITTTTALISADENNHTYSPSGVKVEFTTKMSKQKLFNDLQITNLDAIKVGATALVPTSDQILTAASQFNKNLVIEELGVNNISSTGATIFANENNKTYDPEHINVTFSTIMMKKKLADDLQITNLGAIKVGATALVPTSDQILNTAKSLNPDLIVEDLVVQTIKYNSATIAVADDSQRYDSSSINVKYTLDHKSQLTLAEALPSNERNIGEIYIFATNLPTSAQIISALNNKNIDDLILYGVTAIDINATSATLIATETSIYQTNSIVAVEFVVKKNPLIYLVRQIDLGVFNISGRIVPTSNQILDKLFVLNPNLDNKTKAALVVASITPTAAMIYPAPNNDFYSGSIKVTFSTTITKINLSTLDVQPNIGQFWTQGGLTPADDLILKQFLIYNSSLNFDASELAVKDATPSSATITAESNSDVYEGYVKINYVTNTAKANLSDVIGNTFLGGIRLNWENTVSEQDILSLVKANNPNTDISQLTVKNIEINQTEANGSAVIAVMENSEIYWKTEICVTFNTSRNLNDVIKVRNIGSLVIDASESKVITTKAIGAALLATHPTIDLSQITIIIDANNDGQATIKALDNSVVYTGEVDVIFQIPLSVAIRSLDLGVINSDTNSITNDELATILKAQNNKLVIEDVIFSNNVYESDQGKVDIVPINDSQIYYLPDNIEHLTLNYSLQAAKIKLEEVLIHPALGYINFTTLPTTQQILVALSTQNEINYPDQLMISDITATSALVAVKQDSWNYIADAPIRITFIQDQRIDLNEVLKQKNLTIWFNEENDDLDIDNFLYYLGVSNPNLDTSQIIATESATTDNTVLIDVVPNSTVYFPLIDQITIIYKHSTKRHISNWLAQYKELGIIGWADEINEALIFAKIPKGDLFTNDTVTITLDKPHQIATISTKHSNVFYGSIDLNYKVQVYDQAVATKYIDSNKVEHTINDGVSIGNYVPVLEAHLKAVEITQIGYDVAGAVMRMGAAVKTVPKTLPPEVLSTQSMFDGSLSFNQDISNWDVSHVKNMKEMFLTTISFNQDISEWDVSGVYNMQNMFKNKYTNKGLSSFNQDLSAWDVSGLINASGMFWRSSSYNNAGHALLWGQKTHNIRDMSWMFSGASDTGVDGDAKMQFNQTIDNWDTSSVVTMEHMFSSNTSFNQSINTKQVEVEVTNQTYVAWDTSQVTNLGSLFKNATSFNQSISNWNTAKVTTLESAFSSATAFNQSLNTNIVDHIANTSYRAWDTSQVKNMFATFSFNKVFNQDISQWNTQKVTTMEQMFYSASAFNQDISNWNVMHVKNMKQMFYSASAFNQDISQWNTRNVNNMQSMFESASAFNQNITDWNVGKVTNHSNFDRNTNLSWRLKPKFIK